MIQRIQTLWLVIAAACAFALYGIPFAMSSQAIPDSSYFGDSLYTITDHPALMAMFTIAGALCLLAIFMFKDRKKQLLMGRIAIVFNIIGLILSIILYFNDSPSIGNVAVDEQAGLFLPIVFLVFAFLALRFIGKDEKLVKSMDRLR